MRAEAHISLAALRHNLGEARRRAAGCRVMAVIKADGYGHGLERVARVLAPEVEAFALATLDEARALRRAGLDTPVVLLEGVTGPAALAEAVSLGCAPVLHHPSQLETLEAFPGAAAVAPWLKVDTGMHRLGFPPEAVPELRRRLERIGIHDLRWMTHFARADEGDPAPTMEQLRVFREALAGVPGVRSCANSAALLRWPETHMDWIRPGIMLYGASPFADGCGAELGLRPAMRLGTRLIAVNARRRGDRLGYGAEYLCPEDMPVGVAAIGYGDGYPRHLGPDTPVRVAGRPARLAGRVSMDMILLDLRNAPAAAVDDPVLLWGPELPVERVARAAGTIAYELLCRVGPRVRRRSEEGWNGP